MYISVARGATPVRGDKQSLLEIMSSSIKYYQLSPLKRLRYSMSGLYVAMQNIREGDPYDTCMEVFGMKVNDIGEVWYNYMDNYNLTFQTKNRVEMLSKTVNANMFWRALDRLYKFVNQEGNDLDDILNHSPMEQAIVTILAFHKQILERFQDWVGDTHPHNQRFYAPTNASLCVANRGVCYL
jgi:hypothetical protein